MNWTHEANGPHGDKDRERDNRPSTWNGSFFDFLGILCVAVSHAEVVQKFLGPLTQFKDEAFHDCMATYLRGFDRATLATDTQKPEDPGAVRVLLADRIRKSWNFKRLGREKSFSSESHAGDALNAMFYQPHRIANQGRPSIPNKWAGLAETIETLTALVVDAPTSGYLATVFLNLVESSPTSALLPNVVRASAAWCSAYGPDANFWSEKDIGGRVCGWLDRTLTDDPATQLGLATVQDDLMKSLDTLIQAGVAKARDIEERIVGMAPGRKSA